MREIEEIKKELIDLVEKGNAHVSLEKLFDKIPFDKITEKPAELPYSIWELTEHIRRAQYDILEFITNPDYQEPAWPEDYWPKGKSPSEEEWNECKNNILQDKKKLVGLIRNADFPILLRPIPKGQGQNLFKEILVVADHNSYHTGQILVLMRLLQLW